MASTVLPDISSDYKAGPRISPPYTHLPPIDDPLQTKAATSLVSGTFQFVDQIIWLSPALLKEASSCTFDGLGGRIFLLRRSDPVVVVFDVSGNAIGEWSAAQTGIKNGISIKCKYTNNSLESTTIWVVDSEDSCIRPFDVNGHPLDPVGPVFIPGKEGFGKISDVTWDTSGKLYVMDAAKDRANKRVVIFDSSGAHLDSFGTESAEPDALKSSDPAAVIVDPISRVWVIDSQDPHVRVFTQKGELITDFKIPGYKIFDIRFSKIRCGENMSLTYFLARKIAHIPVPGFLFLVQMLMDPRIPGGIKIPLLPPLTASLVPDSTYSNLFLEEVSPDGYINVLQQSTTGYRVFGLAEQRPMRHIATLPSPVWPEAFSAVLLLHPFKGDESLVVAQLHYVAKRYMLFDMYTQDGRHYVIFYTTVGSSVELFISSKDQWFKLATPSLSIPAANWLVTAGADPQGKLPLRNVPVDWWHQEFGNNQEANWHWFRTDTGHPFRTMNMNNSNPNKLPLLGDYAFIYWPYVTPRNNRIPEIERVLADIGGRGESKQNLTIDPSYGPSLLKDLIRSEGEFDPVEIQQNFEAASTLIPGFKFGNLDLKLPVWPQQFFMNCTMTPINRATPLSTEVTYDWPTKSQRTRMFEAPVQPVIDCQLFNQTAHIFRRFEDGSYKRMADIPGIGPARPDWATAGDGEIVATITNNPVLSPDTVTRIFHNPVNPPYQFWIWYSTNDTPVVFMQTAPTVDEGTSLALADYKELQPTGLIDPHTFDIPYNV